MRAVVHDRYGPPEVLRLEEVERPVPDAGRGSRQGPRDDRQPVGLRLSRSRAVLHALLHRPSRSEAEDSRQRARGRGRGRRRRRSREFEVGEHVFGIGQGAHAEYVCVRESAALAPMPSGLSFDEAAAVCDGAIIALTCLRKGALRTRKAHPDLRRVRLDRNRRGAARQALRGRRHRGLRHEAPRARGVARSRPGDRLHAGGLHAERRDVRRDLRRGRQAVVPAVQALARVRRGLSSRPTSGSCGMSRSSRR